MKERDIGLFLFHLLGILYHLVNINYFLMNRFHKDDNLNLIKTVQIVCGYSFSLIYCNLYFWKTIDNYEKLGNVNFYKKVVIPDYKLKSGMSIFMLAKIVVIVISMIANQKLNMFWFKNDLAEYNMCQICSTSYIYDNEMEFNRFLYKKNKIYNILNK